MPHFFDKGKTKNGHSVILMLRYGDVWLLFGGDLNKSAEVFLLKHYSGLDRQWPWTAKDENEIVNAAASTFATDIAKCCHHGSCDFSDAFLKGFRMFETSMVNTNLSRACLKGGDGEWTDYLQKVTSGKLKSPILNNVIFNNTVMPDGNIFTGKTLRI